MTYDYDLEQPADVHWIPVDLMPPQEIGGGKELHFATLREAVWFVMEDLPPRDRASAQIMSRDRSLQIEEIGSLFEQLKDD
jgi:hypothetical protein